MGNKVRSIPQIYDSKILKETVLAEKIEKYLVWKRNEEKIFCNALFSIGIAKVNDLQDIINASYMHMYLALQY